MRDPELLRYKELSPYANSGSLTREQFLFHETRIVGELYLLGLTDEEIIAKVYAENLFRYPTEKMLRNIARACLKRIHALEDAENPDDKRLIDALVNRSGSVAKQICLYAMMQQNRLINDFMLKVIGNKFAERDYSFSKLVVSSFLIDLQEQDPWVASWSVSTLNKIRQVIVKTLVDNEYLDDINSRQLNTITINPLLEDILREKHKSALAAFNCLY